MLYPTHKKYGILWGLLGIPIGVLIGLIPVISSEMRGGDLFIMVMTVYMALSGALFGARFPDIDSPSSIPARRHPIIQKIFVATGVKHRGKFSHDFASIGIFFLVIYLLISRAGVNLIEYIATTDSTLIHSLTYLTIIIIVYMIGLEVVGELMEFANKTRNKKMWVILNKRKYMIALVNVGWLMLVLILSGVFNIKSLVTGQIGVQNALWSATVVVVLLKVFVVFTLVGAYSHLFADMTTKSGVSIFGIKLAPAQVILKVRNIPLIGKILVPTEFKTGSGWESFVSKILSILIIPAGILAFMVLFGFDIKELMAIINK